MICLLLIVSILVRAASGVNMSMPGCQDECGNVKIPYPFGMGAGCYKNTSYEIICNTSFHPPKPFLHHHFNNLEVLHINPPGSEEQTLVVGIPPTTNICASDVTSSSSSTSVSSIEFGGSPYRFSRWDNVFMVEGCGGSVVLKNRSGAILAGCASACVNNENNTNKKTCVYGDGCCQASLLSYPTDDHLMRWQEEGLDFYQIALPPQAVARVSDSRAACNISAALIYADSLHNFTGRISSMNTVPTMLEWTSDVIGPMHYDNLSCHISSGETPILPCSCGFPYEGNPYLPHGCQVIRECQKCRSDHCVFNDTGNYYYCEKNQLLKRASIIGFSTGMGLMLLVICCYWLYRFVKKRNEIKLKAKYFKRNGGLLLQQQMSSSDGFVEKTKIFAVTELENATDNFNQNRILGQGGQGTVYKGMLMDGNIVAIKKSKKVEESQLEQFINEVVIVSRINHRNIVQLLGCCLETEVPLLVYEFIPNGTLYEHIHDPSEDFHVSWKMRLQIASESAGAVAYLHSSSSAPIYHRDIKSSNILLDDKYRAKVSDFGTSRAIAIEQTHVTTCVQGTYGYLDPEYFQSNQFTEKSDVYSFGVVLVELITGKKPIWPNGSGGWINLATEFLSHMENSRLLDILDPRVLEEGKEEEFTAVADLAKQCLNMNGKQRPTMKEIAMLLDGIRSPHVPNPKEQNCEEGKCAVMEINGHSGLHGTNTFFSASSTAFSIEVQPLTGNT